MTIENEFAKVRAVLHAIVDRIHLPSETEVKELKSSIDNIADTLAGEDVAAPVDPVTVPAPVVTSPDAPSFAQAAPAVAVPPAATDVSSLSNAELEAELARRNAAS